MPKTLQGKCPGCSQDLYIEIAVLPAPRGFAGNEPLQLKETLNADGNGSTPSPDIRSGGQRPVCPACGLDGARLEQTAKKSGRPFAAFKCINTECDQNDEIIPGTFRWGKAVAAKAA